MLRMLTEIEVIAQVYLDAADLIERCGLAWGQCKDGHGRYCLRGAINYVMNGDADRWTDESDRVVMMLSPYTDGMHPVEWSNYNVWRTDDGVVAMLRRAAAEALDHLLGPKNVP